MGMGLAIYRCIIIAHEGNLGFNSENKIGTEFYFTLPLAPNV
jgi:signal transduction histidine kinase